MGISWVSWIDHMISITMEIILSIPDNILFHFLTPVLQIYTIYLMFSNFGFVSILYLALFFVIPFITDGIGHLFEKNFHLDHSLFLDNC